MARTRRVSAAMEDYLEAIRNLSRDGGPVRVTDIADRLGIAKASVTQALGGLRQEGLVEQERYGQVFLTGAGLGYADRIRRRHQTLHTFLVEVLGVPSDQAEREACGLEHSIGPDTLARLVSFLEQYSRDGGSGNNEG